jgi:hypothetical protein
MRPPAVEPFEILVPDAVIDDLRARIRMTRWPEPSPDSAWTQGTDRSFLERVLARWADGFDWRAQEHWLNSFANYRTEIDDVRIHFVHERARDGRGIPLILTHGWPSCFVEYMALVPLLTDPSAHGIDGPSFDVVIPSLPGYGFSERPAHVNYRVVSRIWHRLMQGLGYERYP